MEVNDLKSGSREQHEIFFIDYHLVEVGYLSSYRFTNTPFLFKKLSLITGRNEVLAKVIFSEACVILSTGGGVVSAPNFRGGCLQFSEYGQRSAGTHPTGMHSCLFC